jgi:hypothetical protein
MPLRRNAVLHHCHCHQNRNRHHIVQRYVRNRVQFCPRMGNPQAKCTQTSPGLAQLEPTSSLQLLPKPPLLHLLSRPNEFQHLALPSNADVKVEDIVGRPYIVSYAQTKACTNANTSRPRFGHFAQMWRDVFGDAICESTGRKSRLERDGPAVEILLPCRLIARSGHHCRVHGWGV